MTQTGVLRTWNEDRGFGFIAPTGGGRELFVHVSAFPKDGTRPTIGERVTFEVAPGKDGKSQAVRVQRLALAGAAAPAHPKRKAGSRRPRSSWLQSVVAGVVLTGLLALGVTEYQKRVRPQEARQIVPNTPAAVRSEAPFSVFRCDGRTMCSQMTSCTEAKYFLANCPVVKMDGNHDGVPCERQWCTSPFAK